jgi:hypothetical protein
MPPGIYSGGLWFTSLNIEESAKYTQQFVLSLADSGYPGVSI